jgi:hypothetical protein
MALCGLFSVDFFPARSVIEGLKIRPQVVLFAIDDILLEQQRDVVVIF